MLCFIPFKFPGGGLFSLFCVFFCFNLDFVMYNAHFFAQIFEGKVRMCVIHVYNIPVYNAHRMWARIIYGKIRWFLVFEIVLL